MSSDDPSRKDVFDRAIDLIIALNDAGQRWTTHLITIQAALVAAVGAFFRGPIHSTDLLPLFVLSALGVASALVFTKLIWNNWEWQGIHIQVARTAQGADPILYADTHLPPGFTGERGRAGRTAHAMRTFGWAVAATWVLFFLLQVRSFVCLKIG